MKFFMNPLRSLGLNAPPNIDLTDLLAAVTKAKGVNDSAVALINNFATIAAQKVADALAADDAADQGSVDAAVAAIKDAAAQLNASSDQVATAVAANSTPTGGPTP